MKKTFLTVLLTSSPMLALAQTNLVTDANSLTQKLIDISNVVIYLLIALAVIFIIWNIVMFLIKSGEEDARTKARSSILWGIVGLAIILSIWGLVNILINTFRTTPPITPNPNISNTGVPLIR